MGKIVKKGVVERKPGHLYYVDASGNVCEAKMARGGKKKKAVAKKTVAKKPAAKKAPAKKPAAKKKVVAKKKK
ncbi:MAG: hypothetical protein PHX15_00950 [Candidatus Nanoarchaeia archaeon]|jgi:hypothetical protein|nr:hypothetical protein [Candidatus Nanoarchaeia archaeon]MDD3993748.1 hypothetical protein [Candidatus Nanoarchaeia archaeon]MDD4563484.1 hypothetical protein [Candidatus Nanoarchaeia archaeon]